MVELIFEKPNLFELFAVNAYFLWSQWNKLRLKIDALPLSRVVVKAKRYLSLHKPAMKTRVKPPRTARVKWKPLDRNSYKTNFDGAMFHNSGKAALGVVIQNHEGEVMVALSRKKKYHYPPLLLSWNY